MGTVVRSFVIVLVEDLRDHLDRLFVVELRIVVQRLVRRLVRMGVLVFMTVVVMVVVVMMVVMVRDGTTAVLAHAKPLS